MVKPKTTGKTKRASIYDAQKVFDEAITTANRIGGVATMRIHLNGRWINGLGESFSNWEGAIFKMNPSLECIDIYHDGGWMSVYAFVDSSVDITFDVKER